MMITLILTQMKLFRNGCDEVNPDIGNVKNKSKMN